MNKEDFLRELIHKSWHRGCKETDILLGQFARNCLASMDETFHAVYAEFIQESDWDIYAWLVGEKNFEAKYQNVITAVRKYHADKPTVF